MKRIIGGVLLVAGTSIGAGMLALPVVTAEGGFFPALLIYFFCWLFMTSTGLLLLELCLRLPPDANLVTMAENYLGKWGKGLAWALYLFLFYCLSIAYVSGGGGMIQEIWGGPIWISQAIFVFGFGACVYCGAKMVGRINGLLMTGLIGAYLAFVVFGLPHVNLARLQPANWGASLFALPVIFTSFSYQGLIPSLTTYLHRDAKALRLSIVGGTSLTFLVYLVWELLILGIVPQETLLGVQTAVIPFKEHVAAPAIATIGHLFAFCALTTSFLGVTLGLLDFLSDALKMPKKGFRKAFLALLTFAPPLVVSWIQPNLFIVALVFAGGIGCTLLLGLLPIWMAWISRYRHQGHDGPILLGGGRAFLSLLLLFVVLELAMEAIQLW